MICTLRRSSALACAVAVIALTLPARAESRTPHCDTLSKEQQETRATLFKELHPYNFCDNTLERCLAGKAPHRVLLRIANDVCRQIKLGRSRTQIEHALAKRSESLDSFRKPVTFGLDESTLAGDPKAPITVVVYACARCPYCRQLVPALHEEVTKGVLRGKAKLYFRPFPLKEHEGAVEGGLAMLSAAQLGAFWPFTLRLYANYDHFCPKLLPEWATAEDVGMDRSAFEDAWSSPSTRKALVGSKQEGLRNKVDATPTLFIEGRKYVAELKMEVITDIVEEAYETRSTSGN